MSRVDRTPGTALFGALFLVVIGGSSYNVLPLLTAAAVESLKFTGQQVGILSLAISIGSSVSSLLAGAWIRTARWRIAAAVALAGVLLANSLSMLMQSYVSFVLLQGAAGFFAAMLFSLGMTMLSDHPASERNFGIANSTQVAYQIAALLLGPTLLRLGGVYAILTMLALPAGLAFILVPKLHVQGRAAASTSKSSTRLVNPATLLALVAFGVFFVNAGAYWTYIELMGRARGLSPQVVANSVSIAVSAGIVGGALAWLVGSKYGRLLPLCSAGFLTICAGLLLTGSFGEIEYIESGLLYFFSWNCSLAYQLAVVNSVDLTGRGVAVTGAFGYAGSGAGAGLASLFVVPGNYSAVIWIVIIATGISTVLFVVSSVLYRRDEKRRHLAEAVL